MAALEDGLHGIRLSWGSSASQIPPSQAPLPKISTDFPSQSWQLYSSTIQGLEEQWCLFLWNTVSKGMYLNPKDPTEELHQIQAFIQWYSDRPQPA